MDALLLRSWRPFLDYRHFALPSSFGDLKERLRETPKYYAANYAFVGGFLCLIECLLYSPFIVFLTSVCLLFAAWFAFSDLPLHIGSVFITPTHKSLIGLILGLLTMYLTGSAKPLMYVSFSWFALVLLHATFRRRTVTVVSNSPGLSSSPSSGTLGTSNRRLAKN